MKQTEFIEKMSGIDPKFVSEAANYKPKRANYIKVIAIAACFAMMLTTLTVWAFTMTVEKSTYDTICELAETKDGVFSTEKLDQKEIFFDLSQENLNEIFSAFDVILANNDTLVLYEDDFIKIMLNNYDIEYTVENRKIITVTDADANALKYVMLASAYFENFQDNLCYVHTPEERKYLSLVNYDFIISFDYAEYGYDNATEYYNEYFYPNRFDTELLGDKTYRFAAIDIDLYVIKENAYESPAENLLSMLNPYITNRQEAMNSIGNISDLPPEILEQFKDLLTD